MMQTTLFGVQNEIKEKESNLFSGKIKWSFSKRSTLDSCLRKYFYQYYGSRKEYPKSLEIQSFKRLSPKQAVFGHIIHWIISCSLRSAQKGNEWDQDQIVSFGLKMVNDSIQISEHFRSITEFSGKESIFMEIVFGEEKSDDLRDEAIERIETCIDNLFDSMEFYNIYEAGKLEDSLIERSTPLKLNNTITVRGQLDVAYYGQHSLKIVDWKTGVASIEDSNLQLAVYALWASKIEKISPENIEISKAYLYDDSLDSLVFNSIELDRAKARILQDAYRMNELEEFAKKGSIDAFDMCESIKVCEKCSFKRLCYET